LGYAAARFYVLISEQLAAGWPWRPECGWNLSDVISRGVNLSDCHFAFKSSLGRESEPIGSPLVRFSGKAAVSVPPVFSIDAYHAARSIG
ncbi:MAG: hypothetical protein WAV27_19210, partial [Xanthobacteraceae bacterium]